MKYKGKKLEGRNVEVLVLLRNGESIAFRAEAIANYDEFDKLVPQPVPPEVIKPGNVRERNFNDPIYKKKMEMYADQKTNYTVIKSLQATKELEWDTVDIEKQETWKNWRTELAESGFTDVEVMRIINLVTKANALDDEMLEEARQNFLLTEARQEE